MERGFLVGFYSEIVFLGERGKYLGIGHIHDTAHRCLSDLEDPYIQRVGSAYLCIVLDLLLFRDILCFVTPVYDLLCLIIVSLYLHTIHPALRLLYLHYLLWLLLGLGFLVIVYDI
jgi:hypothetical protein